MNVLILQEGFIVSVSTPYPPAPFRVRSGTVDTPLATISYQVLYSLSLIFLQNPVDFALIYEKE